MAKVTTTTIAKSPIAKHIARTLLDRTRAFTMKMLRLTAYFAVVGAVLAIVAARLAYAHARDVALSNGDELIRLTEAGKMTGVYKLRLNGELVKIATASTGASPTEVLDRFEGECAHHADGMADEFSNLPAAVAANAKPKNEGFPGIGMLRKNDVDRGVVVCFAQGGPTNTGAVFGRLAEFASSGDLAKVGHVRYVMAKSIEGTTQVVALWTDGSFDVKKMFPDEGDAPGNDAPGALRPPSSRRLLTAYAEGAPYGVRVYESSILPHAMLAQYDGEMAKLGWTPYPEVKTRVSYSRVFSKGPLDLIVTAERHGDITSVSIVEMGNR